MSQKLAFLFSVLLSLAILPACTDSAVLGGDIFTKPGPPGASPRTFGSPSANQPLPGTIPPDPTFPGSFPLPDGLYVMSLAYDDIDERFFLLSLDGALVYEIDRAGTLLATHTLPIPPGSSAIGVVPGAREVILTDTTLVMGFRVDLETATIAGTFCLEPYAPFMANTTVAYDDATDRIYVAPSFDDGFGGADVISWIEIYDRSTGALYDTHPLLAPVRSLDLDPATGAMFALRESTVWLLGDGVAPDTEVADLHDTHGIIQGLSWARDRTTGAHFVHVGLADIDFGLTNRVVEVP